MRFFLIANLFYCFWNFLDLCDMSGANKYFTCKTCPIFFVESVAIDRMIW